MSLNDSNKSEGALDKELEDFLEVERRKQEFQALMHNLTDICWDVCVDKPAPYLNRKIQACLTNCVERFIDTTNYITNRISRSYVADVPELEMK